MLDWKETEEGVRVPSVGGQLLASGRAPLKEARGWVDKARARFGPCDSIFVLGLGGGFHVRAVAEAAPEKKILVIERDVELIKSVRENTGAPPENVSIFSPAHPKALFYELDVQDALSSLYCILPYAASVRIDPPWYRYIQDWLTGRNKEGFHEHLALRPTLRGFFENARFEATAQPPGIHEIELAIRRRGVPLDETDMLWLALRELVI